MDDDHLAVNELQGIAMFAPTPEKWTQRLLHSTQSAARLETAPTGWGNLTVTLQDKLQQLQQKSDQMVVTFEPPSKQQPHQTQPQSETETQSEAQTHFSSSQSDLLAQEIQLVMEELERITEENARLQAKAHNNPVLNPKGHKLQSTITQLEHRTNQIQSLVDEEKANETQNMAEMRRLEALFEERQQEITASRRELQVQQQLIDLFESEWAKNPENAQKRRAKFVRYREALDAERNHLKDSRDELNSSLEFGRELGNSLHAVQTENQSLQRTMQAKINEHNSLVQQTKDVHEMIAQRRQGMEEVIAAAAEAQRLERLIQDTEQQIALNRAKVHKLEAAVAVYIQSQE